MRLRRGIPIHALSAVIVGVVCSAPAIAQPAAGTAAAQHELITGTIWRIDSRAGTLDLLTGVGHSVRVHRIRFALDLKVRAGSAQPGVAALVPGAVCRIACDTAPSGPTATSVEVLFTAAGRTP